MNVSNEANSNVRNEVGVKVSEHDNDLFIDQQNNVDAAVNITVVTAIRTGVTEQAREVAGEAKVIEKGKSRS